ncbi:retrotransposon protein, putative, ty1-copia subclass [Tanacetum coccineum]
MLETKMRDEKNQLGPYVLDGKNYVKLEYLGYVSLQRKRYNQVYIPKPKNLKPTAMERSAKDNTCHHCKEVGHCKRNCPAYLAELIKKKKKVGTASSSDVFIIELFSFPTKSWVYDTSCGKRYVYLSTYHVSSCTITTGDIFCLDDLEEGMSITALRIKKASMIEMIDFTRVFQRSSVEVDD